MIPVAVSHSRAFDANADAGAHDVIIHHFLELIAQVQRISHEKWGVHATDRCLNAADCRSALCR